MCFLIVILLETTGLVLYYLRFLYIKTLLLLVSECGFTGTCIFLLSSLNYSSLRRIYLQRDNIGELFYKSLPCVSSMAHHKNLREKKKAYHDTLNPLMNSQIQDEKVSNNT